jgi:hypothetical protein
VGTLHVDVPDNATVSVDGPGNFHESSLSSYQSDSLRKGTYQIVASVPAPNGCPTASENRAVAITPGKIVRVRLDPRSCGTLVFTSKMRDAGWSLKSLMAADSGAIREGNVPANVLLPTGDYQRAISKPKCSPYIDTVRVPANKTVELTSRQPIC